MVFYQFSIQEEMDRVREYVPVLADEEYNKHHLQNEPQYLEDVCEVDLLLQEDVILNDVSPLVFVFKRLLLLFLYHPIYQGENVTILDEHVQVDYPDRLEHPENVKSGVDFSSQVADWQEGQQIHSELSEKVVGGSF